MKEKSVWAPSDPAAGHAFIYLELTIPCRGAFSTDRGAFKMRAAFTYSKR